LNLVLAALPEEHPQRELLVASERAAGRAAELTGQLLGFARRSVIRPSPIKLNAIVGEVVGLLKRALDPRIVVTTDCPADLGTVRADAGQMHQVIMNLCLNARDAIQDSGRIEIATSNVELSPDDVRQRLAARPGRFVCFTIRDTGRGMAPDVRARVFEPFF